MTTAVSNAARSDSQLLITAAPERMGGVPVFAGTRVPVETMFDYLKAGDPLSRFLEHFPDVTETHARAVLDLALQSTASQLKNDG
jgi:uncharacterized protein (DUF433 family)